MKVSLVTTSVHIPVILETYARNAREYGHNDIEFIVIGDRKSDLGMSSFCSRLQRNYYPCEYLNIDAQHEYLSSYRSRVWKHLRFASRQRRIVGLLRAWENGADLVISIDPQDQIIQGDFIASHSHVGQTRTMNLAASLTGWFNSSILLSASNSESFFFRGFPMEQRKPAAPPQFESKEFPVAANSGFCLGHSDLDAATNLDRSIQVTGFLPDSPKQIGLAPGTWSPFPAHNLALKRELIPAYFLSPYAGRYDDIWASYIVSRIAGQLSEVISFGSPCVNRNSPPANLAKDLEQEIVGYRQTDRFCQALRSIPLSGTSYHECFGQLASALPSAWPELPKSSGIEIEARNQMLAGLAIWHELFASIQAHSASNLLDSVSRETTKPSFTPALRH